MCLSFVVRKLQVAIIARSSREISQTVRIDCHSFLSVLEVEVVWACDAKIGALRSKEGDENESTSEDEERKA